MPDPINEADLTALLAELRDRAANGYKGVQYAALTALVAERYRLGKCVAELERRLESNPPASDLRERLVCAALTGMLANSEISLGPEDMGDWAVRYADAMIAAMRKGESDGK